MKKNTQEVRSIVAKLLSTENITVRHGNFHSAFFDVKSRLLGLPIWKECSEVVYDMLVGHEVAHALWTPRRYAEGMNRKQARYLNICEDVRIERMIQKKYPGLVWSFQEAYDELVNQNFFKIKGKDLTKLSFPDRANLAAKCGERLDIRFTDEEQKIYDMMQRAETFEQVEAAAKAIEAYMKDIEEQKEEKKKEQEKKKQKKDKKNDEDQDPSGDSDDSDDESDGDQDGDEDSDGDDSKSDKKDKKDSKKKDKKKKKSKKEEDSEDEEDGDDSKSKDEEEGDEEKPKKKKKASEDEDGDDADSAGDDDADDEDSDDSDEGDEDSQGSGDGDGDDTDEGDDESDGDEKNSSDKSDEPSKSDKASKAPLNTEGGRTEGKNDKGIDPLEQDTESITDQAFEAAIKNLVDDSATARYTVRAFAPSNSLVDKTIFDIKKVMAGRSSVDLASKTSTGFDSFLLRTKKFIAMLQKEFEQRKAASQYIRSTVAKTGTINVNRLHAYKCTDDIFKSVTVLANAKNHGLVMLVDYSGSMSGVIKDVYIQVINISMFCRACSIPFEVYGFTDGNQGTGRSSYSGGTTVEEMKKTTVDGQVDFGSMKLINVMSSSMSSTEFKKGIKQLWTMTQANVTTPALETLSGTPLNEAILASHSIIARFKVKHKVEKMSFLVVSDGQSNSGLRIMFDSSFAVNVVPGGTVTPTDMEMNLCGKKLKCSLETSANTRGLIQHLSDSMQVRTICFYLTSPSGIPGEVAIAIKHGRNKKLVASTICAKVAEENMAHVPGGHNYDDYFVIANNLVVDNSTFAEKSTATSVTAIGVEFQKHALSKKFSRAFSVKFAEAIR